MLHFLFLRAKEIVNIKCGNITREMNIDHNNDYYHHYQWYGPSV